MKKMLPISLFALSFLIFGCSKHQFVFIEGYQDNISSHDYIIANDSLEIIYNFSGNNIPVNIRVRNKSEKPVYIDWKKCAAIIDGKKYNYWNEISTIQFSGTNVQFSSNNISFFDGHGTIIKDERISYIPPHSYIETTRIFLQTRLFENLPMHNRQRLEMSSEDGPISVLRYNFSEENSPLFFRSLLTFSSKESFTEETIFEKTFWVSEIIESHVNILTVEQKNQANGIRSMSNTSTISKVTTFGAAAGTLFILGATTGILFLASEKETE